MAEVINHLNVVEMMMGMQKMRARKKGARQSGTYYKSEGRSSSRLQQMLLKVHFVDSGKKKPPWAWQDMRLLMP